MGDNLKVSVGLGVALAPAVNPLVGVDFYEAQVLANARVDKEALDVGYSQSSLSAVSYQPSPISYQLSPFS